MINLLLGSYAPVILDVYFKYNQYIAKPICEKYNDVALMLSNQQIRFIKDKIDELNSLSGWDLTYKSRDTLPWKNTFKDGKGKGNIIKTQMIKDYFLGGKI